MYLCIYVHLHVQYATNSPRNLQLPPVYVIHLRNIITNKTMVLLTNTSLIRTGFDSPRVVIRRLLELGDVSLKRRLPKLLGGRAGKAAGWKRLKVGRIFWYFLGRPFFGVNALRKQIFIARWISSSRLCFRRCINRRKICKFGLRHKLLGGRYLVLATIGQLKFKTTKSWTSLPLMIFDEYPESKPATGQESKRIPLSQPLLHLKLLKHQMPKLHGPPPWQWKWVTVGDKG